MHILLPQISYPHTELGQKGKALNIPEASFNVLQTDFEIATHFSVIKTLNFKKISGIYIRANYKIDALIAAIYAYKQYAIQNELSPSDLENDDPLLNTWQDGTYKQLPIINQPDFLDQFSDSPNSVNARGPFLTMKQLEEPDDPYWAALNTPLIINTLPMNLDSITQALEMQNRLVLLIEYRNDNPMGIRFSMKPDEKDQLKNEIPNYLKKFLFETNIEYVQIPAPETPYLVELLPLIAVKESYKIASDVNGEEVINLLKEYRQTNFQGASDVHLLIQKAIRYTGQQCINEQALKRFFINQDPKILTKPIDHSTAYKKLHDLIGLANVKADLTRLVERMKFTARRKQAGLPNLDHHMAAVFAGSPGTCKTTIARIFGELLLEANVLTNNIFLEISRKDLIGQYVGWTAPKVQEIFDKAKGGTIFIDEAYSLLPLDYRDNFSEEALATIIQCMENNPETLVIFAGYTNEMIHFIKNANTGLRSRLTNIIQFDDYNADELIAIFYYTVKQGNYIIDQTEEVNAILHQFTSKMMSFSNTSQGNGRLMRKLVSTAVGYMAMRNSSNLNILTPQDIEISCEELIKAEKLIQQTSQTHIGFNYR